MIRMITALLAFIVTIHLVGALGAVPASVDYGSSMKHVKIKRSVETTDDNEGITNSANEFFLGYIQNYVQPYIRHLKIKGTYLSLVVDGPNSTMVRITHAGVAKTYQLTPGLNNIAVDGILVDHTNDLRVEGHWDRFKGLHVKAMDRRQISIHGFSEEIHTIEGYTAFPCAPIPDTDVYEYYAVSVPLGRDAIADTTSFSPNSSFLIVACQDNTSVTITATQAIIDPNHPNRKVPAGDRVTFVLNQTQTLYISSPYDLSGSHITSNLPITLISGHECGNVPHNVSQCDHMMEQIPPTLNWGKRFLLGPTAGRIADDIVKVVSGEADVAINVSCTASTPDATPSTTFDQYQIIEKGGMVNFTKSYTHGYCYMVSSQPVLVVKFAVGVDGDRQTNPKGDPFMVLIPAVEQYLNQMVFATAQQFQYSSLSLTHYLNIFVPENVDTFNSSHILLDGEAPTTEWAAVPCNTQTLGAEEICGYSTQVSLSGPQVAHRLAHSRLGGRVSGVVYGFAYRESYAYVAGFNLSVSKREPCTIVPVQTSYITLSGHSVCLPCELDCQFEVSPARWRFGEIDISDLTSAGAGHFEVTSNGSLCINDASPSDSGSYYCLVGSDVLKHTVTVIVGIVIQEPMCLHMSDSPSTTVTGIGSGTVYVNASSEALMICCPIEGERLSSIWKKNGQPLTNGSGYEVRNDYLRIESLSSEDSCDTYTCEVSFVGVTATVQESTVVCTGDIRPPEDVRISGDVEIIEGENLSLTCTASGFPQPEIMWLLDSIPQRVWHMENDSTLLIPNVREKEITSVCCIASNAYGSPQHCEDITVWIVPEILKPSTVSVIIIQDLAGEEPYTKTAQTGQTVLVLEDLDVLIDCPIERGYPKPDITWMKDGNHVSNDSTHTIFSNGSLLLRQVNIEDHEGDYTCLAMTPNVGRDNATTSLDVIVVPKIATPPSSPPLPGSCLDRISVARTCEQVGIDLCVKAGPGTQLVLGCELKRGDPKPIITWLIDDVPITEVNGSYTQQPDGTLSVEDILLPGDAVSSHQWDASGLYTCIAENIAGSARASSYIFPFGNISEDLIAGYFRPQHMELYHQLQTNIAENIAPLASGHQHLALFTNGKILQLDDYTPGRYFDGSVRTIRPRAMENMFNLVDVIPEATSIISNIHHGRSLAKAYESLVEQLQVSYDDMDPMTLTEARSFLQEKVEDLGGELTGLTPRLMLYFHYKKQYHHMKLEVEISKDKQQRRLSSRSYITWLERNAFTLDGLVNDSYTKWEVFGSRTEVERRLTKLNLQDRSEPLENARAVLEATRRRSKYRQEESFYPVKFFPEKWYKLLDNRVEESIQQLQHHVSNLRAQREVLTITKEYLDEEVRLSTHCNTISIDVPLPPSCPTNPRSDSTSIFSKLTLLTYQLEDFVTQSEKSRYQCLVTRSPEDCHTYTIDYDVVTSLMDIYAELYFEVKFVETSLNHRDFTIPALSSRIASLNKEIDLLESFIQLTLISPSPSEQEHEDNYPPEIQTAAIGVADFQHSSTMKKLNTHDYDFTLPDSIEDRLLWHLNPTSTTFVPEEVLQEYKDTFDHMNSVKTNITATVKKVDIERKWFKPMLFSHSYFTLANQSLLVSPGHASTPASFRDTLVNVTYQLPLYPSSILLATDIKLHIQTPFPLYSLPTLLRMSTDDHIHGGFGPFQFGKVFPSTMGRIKFRVEVQNNLLVMTLPGTQVIGYVCDIVPKFPVETRSSSMRERRSTLPILEKENEKKTTVLEKWLVSKKGRMKEQLNRLPSTDIQEGATQEEDVKLHLDIDPTSALLHRYTHLNYTSSHTPTPP